MGQLFKKKIFRNSLNSAFLITVLLLALLLSLTQVSKSFGAGQTLVIGMFKEPARLDGRSNSASAHYLPNSVEFLVWPDWDMKLRPQLATSWEISKDGKRYVFHLRKGVKFHCGYPFDAEAVKMNLEGALGRLEGWRKSKESGMIELIAACWAANAASYNFLCNAGGSPIQAFLWNQPVLGRIPVRGPGHYHAGIMGPPSNINISPFFRMVSCGPMIPAW